jgi:hypothetical protein
MTTTRFWPWEKQRIRRLQDWRERRFAWVLAVRRTAPAVRVFSEQLIAHTMAGVQRGR